MTNKYKNADFIDNEIESRVDNLSKALKVNVHPYSTLAAELDRLLQFNSAISRKSLYRLIFPLFQKEQEYLLSRVSGDDIFSHPFAWPPAREFFSKYFSASAQHAVITVPTGGGRDSLLS